MKGATEAVKEAKQEQAVKEIEKPTTAAVIIDSEGNKPINGPVEIKQDSGVKKVEPKQNKQKEENKVLESPKII